ncbi:bifunctional DNA primase/polymerase [Streptomyces canus]|uniref:bifunctional DNA primase/polymerase n=1 Tax=Streptomyces canus TaxID=58343 RepID=UPI00324A06CD
MTPLDGALWLIRHNFAVFGCDHPGTPNCTGLHKTCDGSRGKHPTVAFTRAWTLDERKIHETFGRGLRNPAVAVGACSFPDGTRLAVVDSDRVGAIEEVARALGEQWPATMRVWTAKGHHDYVRVPAALKLGNSLGSLRGKFDGDIRAGNAFVVSVGAVHATGVLYELEDPERPPAVAPGWLLDALTAQQVPDRPQRRHTPRQGREIRSLDGLVNFVLRSRPGSRNGALYWAACRAWEHVADGHLAAGDVEAELIGAAIQIGLSEAEAHRTVASASRGTGVSA